MLEYSMAGTLFDDSQLRIMLREVVRLYFPLEIGVENKDQQLWIKMIYVEKLYSEQLVKNG